MRFLVICLLLAWLAGCGSTCPPEDEPPEKVLFYVNNSGIDVNLILKTETKQGEDTEDAAYYTSTQTHSKREIKNNDTLRNEYRAENCSPSYLAINLCGKSIYVKIEFLGEPKTCLVFDGDKIANDIRYWENYALTEETSSYLMYYYYINSSQKAMAKEEYCF
jgi:hypothetical protein